jgi:hypothetical protein
MEFLSNCNSSNDIIRINYNRAVIILSILGYYALPDNGSFRPKHDVSKSFLYILINILVVKDGPFYIIIIIITNTTV